MNSGNYLGRLTKDFEIKGKVGMGTVAVDRPYPFNKDQDGKQVTDFLNIKIIGEKNVNRAADYLKKGTKIAFQGHTFRDTYKDKDGNWKESNYIMVTTWEFAESKGNGSAAVPSAKPTDNFMDIPQGIDEELPFA